MMRKTPVFAFMSFVGAPHTPSFDFQLSSLLVLSSSKVRWPSLARLTSYLLYASSWKNRREKRGKGGSKRAYTA